MNRISVVTAPVAAALVVISTVALAAEPTPTDFDACNRMAQSKLSEPSASPQTQPQTGAKTSSSAAAAPQAAPSPQTAGEARVENQADQLRGIAGTSKDDPTYQQVYRDCMKRRGF
jgi:hypothetical protein